MSGRKHSDKTRTIISEAKKGENNPMFGLTGQIDNSGRFNKGQSKPEGSGKPSQQILVTDSELNITTFYNSMSEAAHACPASLLRRPKYF
jgi:hypothetical protein